MVQPGARWHAISNGEANHVYEGEGHGWRKTETIAHFYTAVERFLRQYVVFS